MKTNHYFKLLLFILLLVSPRFVMGTNYYWVGGASAWDVSNGWATTSGGTGTFTWNNSNGSLSNTAYFTSDASMAIFTSTSNIKVGGLNCSANVSISGSNSGLGKFVLSGGTTTPATVTVSSGKFLDLGNIQFSTSPNSGAGSGITKTGTGELAVLGSNNTASYVFGCTLTDGVLTLRGSGALGSGALTLNGGTLIMGADNLTPAVTGITLGGDFTLGGSSAVISGTSAYSITFPNVTTTLTANRIITIGGSGTYTFGGQVTGAYSLTVAGSGGGKIVLTNTSNNYSGGTIINGSKLELGASEVLANAGTVTLGGSTLSSGATTGYSETMGTLGLTDNSTISLGTGSHTLTFADSHSIGWTAGKTLTINGWSGTVGVGGSAGKIIVGVGGLSSGQLSQIAWGGGYSGAVITASGELVPTSAPIITPTLSAAVSATVDAPFSVTLDTDNPAWRSAITGITVNSSALDVAAYDKTTAGQITFTPSASVLLQSAGSKNIVISASGGYADATVTQTIGFGAENKIVIATQPKKASVSGGTLSTQPIVNVTDQYGNIVTSSTTSITASVATGTWTLGGTATVAAASGVATFSGLTATFDAAGVSGASISFAGGSLASATSNTFNLSAAEPTAQVTGLNFTSVGNSSMTINWTPAVSGSGTNHIVLVRATSDLTAGPTDNVSYTANTVYGSGSAVGSGYVVYNGTGNSVTVTGLTALTTYYVKVYDFNGSGGLENFLTTSPTSTTQATGRRTITSVGSGAWGTAGTWDLNTVPTSTDNVVIDAGHTVDFAGASTPSCYNLTVNSTGKLYNNDAANIAYLGVYGTNMTINGTFGGKTSDNLSESFTGLQFNQSCTVSGSGTFSINRMRPISSISNATFTFNLDATFTNNSMCIMGFNSANDNIGYTINTGKTVSLSANASASNLNTTNSTGSVTFSVDGTLNLGQFYMNVASGKTFSLTVNGTLNVKNLNATNTIAGGGATPTITVNGTGAINVTGTAATADFSNASTSATVTGTGTFSLASGATISVGAADGLNSTTGPIRCSTRTFPSGANYTFTGSGVQTTGSDMPTAVNILTINNLTGVTISKNTNVNNSIVLTSGNISTGSYTLTVKGPVSGSGSIDASSGTLGYGGSAALTTSNILNNSVGAFSVNNVGGVTLGNSLTVNGTTTLTAGSLFLGTNTLTLKGNINTTLGDISGSSGTIIFAGISNQSNAATIIAGTLNIIDGSAVTNSGSITASTLNIGSTASGTGTYIDNGTSNITTTNVDRYLGAIRNWYITSPVATVSAPSTNITRYYEYVEPQNNSDFSVTGSTANWLGHNTGFSMTAGKGYIAQASAATILTFSGALNNNSQYATPVTWTSAPSKAGFNLVGNPYPAYLDWSLVIADAANANIGTTMWYRTKNTGDAYTFATHNGTSGMTVTGTANTTISKFIPPMQAFWIRVNDGTASTNFTVKKTMLAHRDVSGNTLKAPKVVNQSVLRLLVSNDINSDESVLYFNPNASNSYDAYDSPKMSNNNVAIPEIYTLAGNEQLVINGMNAIPYNVEIPLGFVAGQSNTYKIKASEFSGFDVDTQVYLMDKLLNTETQLDGMNEYSFSSDVTSGSSRFSIIFKSSSVTTSTESDKPLTPAIQVINGNNLSITNYSTLGNALVNIYNVEGQLVYTEILRSNNQLLKYQFTQGIYMVSIEKNGKKLIQKVIIQ